MPVSEEKREKKKKIDVGSDSSTQKRQKKVGAGGIRERIAAIPDIKSASFTNGQDSDGKRKSASQEKDLSFTRQRSGSGREGRYRSSRTSRATKREIDKAKWSALHLIGLNKTEQKSLREMALETDEKFHNFLVSERGQAIQKVIYEQLPQVLDGQTAVNHSLDESPSANRRLHDDLLTEAIVDGDIEAAANERLGSATVMTTSNNNGGGVILSQFVKSFLSDQENRVVEINNPDTSVANVCVICYDESPDTVYMPCGHGGVCYDCGIEILKKTGECYLCRGVVTEVFQVDLNTREGKNFKVIAVTQIIDETHSTLQDTMNPPRYDQFMRQLGEIEEQQSGQFEVDPRQLQQEQQTYDCRNQGNYYHPDIDTHLPSRTQDVGVQRADVVQTLTTNNQASICCDGELPSSVDGRPQVNEAD